MAEDDADEEETPTVDLGPDESIDGAPIGRVSSRLTWPQEKSSIIEREGDSEIRTPDGPRRLAAILEAVDIPHFGTRQEFTEAVYDEIGRGPVTTTEE